MGPALRQQLYSIASNQHGVIAAAQGRPFASGGALRREFESERWSPVVAGVHAVAGVTIDGRRMAMARLLRSGPGAVVSHGSALALWGIPGHELAPLHVTRIRHTNGVRPRVDGVVPHESRRLPDRHITVHDGFAVVTPSRAIADVAGSAAAGTLERWLDRAWSERLVSYGTLLAVVTDLGGRGRPGIAQLAKLLAARGSSYVPPASGLESRLNAILERGGVRRVARQVNIGGSSWLGRVDFVIQGSRLVIEAQSHRHHSSLSSARDDALRFEQLRAAGFAVLAVWEEDVWGRPESVLDAVRSALRGAA